MPGLKTIYDRTGTPICDIRAAVQRSWLLNDVGQASFSLATTDPKCTEEALQYGNFLYLEHDTLPAWVGIIDTPRRWHHGYVDVMAYEAPYILKYRNTPSGNTLSGTAGSLFEQILAAANQQGDTLISAGDIFYGGPNRQETMNDSAFVHIARVQQRSAHDWLVSPEVVNGKLYIYMSWTERAGIYSDVELAQGKNIQHGDSPLEESGELLNDVTGVINTLDAGVQVAGTVRNEGSLSLYGLRQAVRTFSGNTNADTVLENTRQLVEAQKTPDITTSVTAIDATDTFINLRLGNVMNVRYKNVGFSSGSLGMLLPIRVMGMRYDETGGTVELYLGKVPNA